VRLPPTVHGRGDDGFIPTLITIARACGQSGYVGDGANRWPAVHRNDAARVFRLALEEAPPASVFHAVADEGVPTRTIAEVIGRHLDVPVVSVPPDQAGEHFGFLGRFFAIDAVASSALTRERLDWSPTEPGLIEDLDEGHYFADTAGRGIPV
jgi:nucleoside-diphosphate-sugar epimerase